MEVKREPITANHVRMLMASNKLDAVLVRASDGTLRVRTNTRGFFNPDEGDTILAYQDDLRHNTWEWDPNDPSEEEAAAAAEIITQWECDS